MSKMKLLHQVVEDLKQLSDSIDALVKATEVDTKQETPPVTITLEQVRAVLADKSRLGFTKDIKALLGEFGVSKLSDVKASDYPSLLEKAEVLGNE